MPNSDDRHQPAARGELFLLFAMAIILPPLPIFLIDRNIFSRNFIISCLLTLCGGIAGLIFSCYIIYLYLKHESILDGYTRLDDDEEQQLHAHAGRQIEQEEHQQEQEQPTHSHRIHHDEEHTQPDPNQILTASDLPSYDDIVGRSNGSEQPRDVKTTGDHKVQK